VSPDLAGNGQISEQLVGYGCAPTKPRSAQNRSHPPPQIPHEVESNLSLHEPSLATPHRPAIVQLCAAHAKLATVTLQSWIVVRLLLVGRRARIVTARLDTYRPSPCASGEGTDGAFPVLDPQGLL
jgi:hypothetical protein